jgi:uncharacterized protein YecA (UPF0149 family)
MADYFGDRYFPPGYFPAGYFEGGEQNPGAMSASLSGAGGLAGDLTAAAQSAGQSQSGASGGSGSRWWEEGQYRTQRKARQWTEEELDDLVAAAFEAIGIHWSSPISAHIRSQVRKYVEARSHEMNVLLSAAADVNAAISRREQVNVSLRTDDEEDMLLLLAA